MILRPGADGWVTCRAGHRHWGRDGAAGLLLRHQGRYLLQLRSPLAHNGNTWSVPGGARQHGEPALAAALREFAEETGYDVSGLPGAHLLDLVDHGGWTYTTFLAEVAHPPQVTRDSWEVSDHAWFHPEELAGLPLHPDFAAMVARRLGAT